MYVFNLYWFNKSAERKEYYNWVNKSNISNISRKNKKPLKRFSESKLLHWILGTEPK